jgi:outer membrane receptor protein involved in Fe transport
VFGYRQVQHHFINDGDFIGSPFDLETHTIEQYPFTQNLKEKIVYQELRAEFTPAVVGVTQSLIVGGSYERTKGSIASEFIFTDRNGGFPIDYLDPVIPPESEWQHDVQPVRDYRLGVTGLFAQYIVEPTARLVLLGGGRYDRMALENTAEGLPTLEDTFDAFSPKLSATYKMLGTSPASRSIVNAYVSYSRAFLPPRRPSSLTPADVSLNLVPEDIDNVEGGVKGSFLEGRFLLEGTYFWMKEDGVVLSRRQGPFFFPTNAGEQRYKGVETGASMVWSQQLSGFVNASFYRNRFGAFVIQSEEGDEVLTGNRLPISPAYVVNWGVECVPIPALTTTVTVKHVSEVQADRANSFTIGRYSLFDAAATWRRGPFRVTLSAHNLLNTEYYWNANGETADPGRPRQIALTTSVSVR